MVFELLCHQDCRLPGAECRPSHHAAPTAALVCRRRRLGSMLGTLDTPSRPVTARKPPAQECRLQGRSSKASKAVRLFRGQAGVVCMGHCRRKKIAAGSRDSREGAEGGRGMGMACLPLGLGTYVGMKKRHIKTGANKTRHGVAGGCIHTAE